MLVGAVVPDLARGLSRLRMEAGDGRRAAAGVVTLALLAIVGGRVIWDVQHSIVETAQGVAARTAEDAYLAWLGDVAPRPAVLVTSRYQVDPWQVHMQTRLPVLYDASSPLAYMVREAPLPVDAFLGCFSTRPETACPDLADTLEAAASGRTRLLAYFPDREPLSPGPPHSGAVYGVEAAEIARIASYPDDPTRGAWELRVGGVDRSGSG